MNKKKNQVFLLIFLPILLYALECNHHPIPAKQQHSDSRKPPAQIWVTAYLPSWELNMGPNTTGNYGNLPYQNIDWTAFTHLIMFACGPDAYGNLSFGNLLPSRRKPFNDIAHSFKKPVLVSVGGAGNTNFGTAMNDAYRTSFIKNLLALLDGEQYDGLDMDVEPVRSADTTNYRKFIHQLYDSLQIRHAWHDQSKKPLLTAAIIPSWNGEMFVRLENNFDQINIMTYDMGGTWLKKVWHNNAVYATDLTTIQSRWLQQMDFGGNSTKYGIGIDWNGAIWSGGRLSSNPSEGVSEPRQIWSTSPNVSNDVKFDMLFRDYLDTATSATKRWDDAAKASYLKIVHPSDMPVSPATISQPWLDEKFITYTDSQATCEIVKFVKDSMAGGVFLWNIGEAYLPEMYPHRDRMLQNVRKTVWGTADTLSH